MKYIFSLLLTLVLSVPSYSSTVTRNGNDFSIEITKFEDEITPYTWTDKDGVKYVVFESKKGSYYIIKISKKTGKDYKYYLPKEVQEQMRRERGK